jgi:hypothetical protein
MSPHEEAEAAIAAVTAQLPELCAHGMKPTRAGRCDEFTALEFLKQCRKTQKANRSSYGLKHDVERRCHCYIANGELIVAAVFLGFPYHWSGDSPNVLIGVSKRDVQRVSA